MNPHFNKFKELHFQENPLLIGNVWNVQSAKVYKNLGYQAIATSSAAVAHSLGYEDGEHMPFDEYFFIIERIKKSVNMPLSVDLEAGFGDKADDIVSNILRLYKLGIAGINIEDSVVCNSTRAIQEAKEYSEKLIAVTHLLNMRSIEIFINVRCDVYLLNLGDKLNEARHRMKLYEKAKIDGIFLPCIIDENEIKSLTDATALPVNVMCTPQLPGFETLKKIGVRRISVGNFMFDAVYKQMENISNKIINNQSFLPLF